ncbi:MAG TPA: radical SAM protein [Candidatus Omnitrophota bacterium]|nr:radical SAM protein [Candidatus Omnitrophota bacterium]HPT39203.1 radical SAM protein [Candidatus Omnitrophota bacterium]
MKVVFINPNLSGVVGQNIGLAYVISSVERNHQVELWDLTFHAGDFKKYLLEKLQRGQPDIIGFSVNSFSFGSGLEIARFIKQLYPKIIFLWGGIHPTLMPAEVIRHPLVDVLCVGEGEIAALEYLDRVEQGKLPDVGGIWYKDSGGGVHSGPPRAFYEHIDDLPLPNWDHWEIDKYLKGELFFTGGLRHLASRGCPYGCTFCSNAALSKTSPGKYYRTRAPANIIKEIKLNVQKYQAQGLKSIFLSDDIFGLDEQWLEEFCALYIQEGLSAKIPWVCTTRVDILTEKWAKIAAGAGCMMVSLGIESGDEDIRSRVYKKNISKQQIMNAAGYLKQSGIICHISLIIGAPGETYGTIGKTMQLAKEICPLTSQYIFYQPLPKTELLESIKQEDFRQPGSITYLNSPVVFTQDLKKKQLLKIKKQIEFERVSNFFKKGISQQGAGFFLKIMKFCFSLENIKKIFSGNFHIMTNLEQDILFGYHLKRWQARQAGTLITKPGLISKMKE